MKNYFFVWFGLVWVFLWGFVVVVVCLFFVFLGQHLWHMVVPRLGVESELQLLAYTTATTMPDPSHVGDPQHSSRQRQILNPLSKTRDGSHVLMDTSQIRFC